MIFPHSFVQPQTKIRTYSVFFHVRLSETANTLKKLEHVFLKDFFLKKKKKEVTSVISDVKILEQNSLITNHNDTMCQ